MLGDVGPALPSGLPQGFVAAPGPVALCLPPLGGCGNMVRYLVAEIEKLYWDQGHLGPVTKMS